jgi:Mg2+ and Co2+ transporter CorA
MRIFTINASIVTETTSPAPLTGLSLPQQGFIWMSCTRAQFELMQASIQSAMQDLCGSQLLDLHTSDLLNAQLPSRYDYTSQYDLLVFRRLATGGGEVDAMAGPSQPLRYLPARGGPPILRRIDTSPVGLLVLDRVLFTVHPDDCSVRDIYASRLLAASGSDKRSHDGRGMPDGRSVGARGVPASPADMMLCIISQMVDGYLELRRDLTHQLDHWQAELIDPKTRFNNWGALLNARLSLHQLDELCEDQRSAMRDWMENLQAWPEAQTPMSQHERDSLQVRSRDVLEHIERVVHHVRRLEQSAETAVQMHFNAQSHRTNEIMRTLTVLTAIFLPLNLIAGIFGMNFEFIPFLHESNGFWFAMGAMLLIAATLVLVFSRKRYLDRSTG